MIMTSLSTPLSIYMHGHDYRVRYSLERKQDLSLGELIRPFCIMFSYCYLLCFGLLFHFMMQFLCLFSLNLQVSYKEGDCAAGILDLKSYNRDRYSPQLQMT